MKRTCVTLLVASLVLPLVVIGALRIVANDWIVHFEYSFGGLPADSYGFSNEERRTLALLGLDSILPGGAGVDLLRDATLAGGEPAFGSRELRHMEDVRAIVAIAFRAHTAMLGLVVILAVLLGRRHGTRMLVPRALRRGAVSTVIAAALIGIFMAAAWNTFFTGFHRVFFDGSTWWFFADDTLRRVYPDAFWMGVAGWITGIAVALTALTWVGATLGLRRSELTDVGRPERDEPARRTDECAGAPHLDAEEMTTHDAARP